MNINELQVRLDQMLTQQEELLNTADAQQRDFNETEQSQFDTLSRDISAINKSIQVEQKKEKTKGAEE